MPLPNPNTYAFSGTAEQSQIAYFENIRVHIWKRPDLPEVAFSFDLYAGFCQTLEHVGLGILGQDGFFSRFKVILDHTHDLIEVV